MLHLILLAGLAPAAVQPPATVTRSVTVGVCTKKGEPVTDLQAAEFVVSEDGRKAPALSVELDTRPVEVAVVVDSSSAAADMEASQVRTAEAMRAIGQAAATPMIVLVLPGGAGAAMGGPTAGSSFSWDVQGYFERMASGYRGAIWTVLSTQAVEKSLQEAAAQLAAQYRVRYAGAAGEVPPPRVEIRRKGVKTLVGRTQVEVAKID